MRRSGAQQAATTSLVVGDLMVDEDSHEVRRHGEVALTADEFELLPP